MAQLTPIPCAEMTWNPVTGCTKVGPGCDHCYAEAFAERFRGVHGTRSNRPSPPLHEVNESLHARGHFIFVVPNESAAEEFRNVITQTISVGSQVILYGEREQWAVMAFVNVEIPPKALPQDIAEDLKKFGVAHGAEMVEGTMWGDDDETALDWTFVKEPQDSTTSSGLDTSDPTSATPLAADIAIQKWAISEPTLSTNTKSEPNTLQIELSDDRVLGEIIEPDIFGEVLAKNCIASAQRYVELFPGHFTAKGYLEDVAEEFLAGLKHGLDDGTQETASVDFCEIEDHGDGPAVEKIPANERTDAILKLINDANLQERPTVSLGLVFAVKAVRAGWKFVRKVEAEFSVEDAYVIDAFPSPTYVGIVLRVETNRPAICALLEKLDGIASFWKHCGNSGAFLRHQ